MDFESWIQAQGFVLADLSETQTANLRAMFEASQNDGGDDAQDPPDDADDAGNDDGTADPVQAMRTAAAGEAERIASISTLCAGKHAGIEAKAIREGWDSTKTELEILRADRPQAPAVHSHDSSGATSGVLEAACVLSAKLAKPEDHCDEKDLEAAAKQFRGGIGLQELILEAAWANGYTGRNFRDTRAILRAAFAAPVAAAGFSTIDLGGILSNVANKYLLEGFTTVEQVWRELSAIRSVTDFKTVTSYRMTGAQQYELVAPGGEIKHGTLGEEGYQNKADTHALLLSIDRRDIINDDLGAITQIPRMLGRGSGLKINDVFWAVFMANAGFFKTANKNFVSGADSALSIDGLTKAETAFLEQVDSEGKPLGASPALLLVPPALSAIASQLNKSMELRDTSSNTKYPIANPHQGKYRPLVSRYLSNSHYTGNSVKSWYLLSDPRDLPVIETAFLNGQEAPVIETADADFNVLGIQMRGYHDFGVALQEPRGGIKSKGEA
jgi:phage major head subunit gpT-like protein